MTRKKYFKILLFIALIALKVSALHVYSHDCNDEEQIDDCEICEYAIYNQNLEFSPTPQFESLEINDTIPFILADSNYKNVFIEITIHKIIFGRPPPVLA